MKRPDLPLNNFCHQTKFQFTKPAGFLTFLLTMFAILPLFLTAAFNISPLPPDGIAESSSKSLNPKSDIILLPCVIDTISAHAFSPCQVNDPMDWNDDTFTANVRVTFQNKPATGWLRLTGDGMDSVLVSEIQGATEYIFQNVLMSADGTPIVLTAEFTDGGCSMTELHAGDYYFGGQNYTRNAPAQCTVCGGVGATNQDYPSCWPDTIDRGDCNFQEYYAPDPGHPERTPIRYIRTVLHVMQKENPDSVAQGIRWVVHPTDPGNYQNIPEHIAIIRSWFDDPVNGANGFLANLCDDPTDGSPWMKDARIRLLNRAEPGVDLFFHPDNLGWGTGYSGCGSNGVSGLDLNTFRARYIDTIANEETRLAYHVFLTGAKWVRDTIGNPNIPDSTDCYYYCTGGYTNTDILLACPTVQSPTAVISGNYATYLAGTGGTSDPLILECAGGYLGNTADLGIQIMGEVFHVISIDHISPLQAHVNHDNGDDSCADTPWRSTYNKMDCGGEGVDTLRCAFTKCQLGRAHSFFESNRPAFERFPIDNNGHFSRTDANCYITDPDIVIKSGEDLVWQGRRNLRSNIIVEPNARLTITCDVGMPKDARITVHAKGKLYIVGARIYNNCDGDYWDGIIVEGDPSKPHTTVHQVFLWMTSGATVEYASHGVRLQRPLYNNHWGGILWASDSKFRNCRHNLITILGYNSLYGNSVADGSSTRFYNCSFEIDANYQGDFVSDFYQMVYLKNVSGIDFNACKFINAYPTSATAYADQRKYGIQASDVNFSVSGQCKLKDQNGNCLDWDYGEMKGFNRAIYTGIKGSFRTFVVTRTRFSDNLVGIYAAGVPAVYIVKNQFEVGSTAPPAQPLFGDAANRGIELYGCTGYKVEENELKMFNAAGTTKPLGILVNGSGNQPNEVYKNTFDGLEVANLSNGDNRGNTQIEGLVYKCNENSDNKYDFAIPLETGIGQGIAEFQGFTQESAGNTFSLLGANPETNFLNHEAPITYFWQTGFAKKPTHYTISTINLPLNPSQINSCLSKLDENADGLLSETERQQHQSDFENSTETSNRTYAANMLIRHYLTDTLPFQMDSVRAWFVRKGDLVSRFSIVDSWLQESQPDSAQSVLYNIPSQFTFTEEQEVEYSHFSTLKTIQIDALQNSLGEPQMVINHLDMLKAVAEAGDFYASVQAQVLLNEYAGSNYLPKVTLPFATPQAIIVPPTSSPGDMRFTNSGVYVKAIPNPARNATELYYWLPEDATNGKLTLSTLDGRLVWETALTEHSGKVRLELNRLENGIYLYKLVSDGKTWTADKLVITK